MLDFARYWAPYGGGPAEDIMVQFGLTSTQFFTRLQLLLEPGTLPASFDADTRDELLAGCRRRLWLEA